MITDHMQCRWKQEGGRDAATLLTHPLLTHQSYYSNVVNEVRCRLAMSPVRRWTLRHRVIETQRSALVDIASSLRSNAMIFARATLCGVFITYVDPPLPPAISCITD